ncbi:MAG: hypothetical protein HON27_14815 [Candidatus Marinimicrobia bacterium]|jgi:hypothetical protein|nr:hypothetical protein [Gammaproteobacteria bacterium]MBT3966471.1 hypothetical protein [Gammaproteobacteria bacterium]MBT4947425.1 hypothetical protein [Candidatus Neomarinimicrobiota bacterium]MBT5268352.1 hypothetical protein [Candidatus Neomarinimicrobiota bacterium]
MTISFFNVYFSGLILVAVRIGWIMYSRLDVYDWHYYKLEIWIKYIFYQIFWPFLLLNPKRLISGKGYFKHEFAGINIDLAEQDRELDRLWSNPPPCSDILQYSASNYMYSDTSEAMFYFSAQDIERVLKEKISNAPARAHDDEAIFKWVRQHNSNEPFSVPPSVWSKRFNYVVETLIDEGLGEAVCPECQSRFLMSQLVIEAEWGRPGWNFKKVFCPNKHRLAMIDYVHLNISPKDPESAEVESQQDSFLPPPN